MYNFEISTWSADDIVRCYNFGLHKNDDKAIHNPLRTSNAYSSQ